MVKWLLPIKTTRKSTTATTTMMSTRSFLAIVIVIASLVRAINGFLPIPLNGVGRGLAASGTDSRKLFGGYRITPKMCRATKTLPSSDPRAKGPTICMFNHECAQRNGEVVGACMDGFLFGACCQIPNKQDIESTLINDAQNAYFQQYQQQKLQMQQSMSNPVAAQSYENYGESAQQQSPEFSSYKPLNDNYHTTTPQIVSKPEMSSTTNLYTSSTTANSELALENENYSTSQSTYESDGISTEIVTNSLNKTSQSPTISKPVSQPPRVHVHKDSVKISSPSSRPQNDDFVMQVLSTLPPGHENERITFTTEVPMQIASSSLDQFSSESNSFEEITATKIPVQLVKKPIKHKTQQKPTQKPQVKPQHEQNQHPTQQTNSHHHNNLLLNANELTHSSITHTGPDADILDEDLQFSTGYGPQPLIVDAPSDAADYDSSSTLKTPQPEDKYVLVQTISNDQVNNKSPIPPGSPTTSSSITTHVDSIESIILQLNNKNHGPSYSLVNQPEHSFNTASASSSSSAASYQGVSDSYNITPEADMQNNQNTYASTGASTASPASYFEEIETKRPADYQSTKTQVPAYLEPVTTNLNFIPENEDAADHMSENTSFEPSSYKPQVSAPIATYGDSAADGYNENAVPDKNYNDVTGSDGHQTSEFNKMPEMGIAYPVDMSYIDEDGNSIEDTGNQKLSTQISTQKPSTSTNNYSTKLETSTPQPTSTYAAVVTEAQTKKPSQLPAASYIGVVTASTYQNKQPPLVSNYNQVPEQISVTSHTTKVHEDYESSPDYQSPQSQKLTTISYVDTTITTQKPTKISYGSSLATTAARPAYDNLPYSSTTAKPKSTIRPSYNKKKTAKPQVPKKPSTQAPQSVYQQQSSSSSGAKKPVTPVTVSKRPTTSSYSTQTSNYNEKPSETYLTNTYQSTTEHLLDSNAYNTLKQPQLSNQYAADVADKQTLSSTYNTPSQPAVFYNQAQHISSPPAESFYTRITSSTKKPISTSYVTGPATPRPPTTFAYDNEVPPLLIADDKLDYFIHSTAGNSAVASPRPVSNSNYQAPVYANAVTPLQVQQPQSNYNTPHKKPGFVKIKATTRPPAPTVIITPKPTTNSYVKQPNDDTFYSSTTQLPAFASTSYIYSATITGRPEYENNTPEYVSLPSITQGGTSGAPSVTQATYAVPSDDKPAFPGYYGPTPTYPTFQIPGEKNEGSIEETFTSPNDFANFPPVRHPNLNMSATSSAVTSDLELSTPAFVEDGVLKDKMNILVHKIVESLQGNFEALADIIDESATPATYQAGTAGGGGGGGSGGTYTTIVTRKPTRKSQTTVRPKATTKKPVSGITTKTPNKKPTATTRKPATKRTTTRKPVTTRRPTKKPTPTTTNVAPFQDEIIDEEDGEDVNASENEINNSDSFGAGAGGRKIQCGVRPHVKSGRIVGGKGSTFGAFPWQVLVRESTWLGLFTKNKCGGVLITNKYIITAAHCQPGFLASLVAVMGEFDISGDLESKKAVTKNVKRVIVHRQYDPATFENDLALLELESPVQFDTHIVPICMPSDNADFTGRMATVTGWGRLKYGGGVPSVLQEVQVPIIENTVCQEMFHTAGHNKKIINSFLCAGYANGQKDSCEGDSGGPLVLQRPDGRYELAGTVSHGIKCAAPYLPGVYMRTTYYKPWLKAITGVK